MENELQKRVSKASEFSVIELEGEIRLELSESNFLYVGKSFARNVLTIAQPNLTVDGSRAKIILELKERIDSDVNLFFLTNRAKNTELRNLHIEIHILNEAKGRRVCGIFNTANGVKLKNCKIEMCSESSTELIGVYNNGNLDTHMETRADNFMMTECEIRVNTIPKFVDRAFDNFGFYNNLANSISVQNNYIYSTTVGNGENQRAVGVYTNGRFGRFIGNNIKANGSHNTGRQREQAHAYGFINEGQHTIVNANNLVGEWGGKCVGLWNRGDYAEINSNKILATHTIMGRTAVLDCNRSILTNNVLTGTSRNPHLVEVSGDQNTVSNNVMQCLLGGSDYRSGTGVWIHGNEGKNSERNHISGNLISCALDFGILMERTSRSMILGNQIVKLLEAENFAGITGQDDTDLVRDNICDEGGSADWQVRRLRNRDEAVQSI